MDQIAIGTLPFDKLPKQASDVQVFDSMNSPLLSAGKLVQSDCSIVLDDPRAHVLSGDTKDAVRKIIADAEVQNDDDILLTAPFDHATLTWRTTPDDNNSIDGVACNVHRIRSKEILVNYLHRAAGYPMKKTWLQAIKNGFFATWPGLTYELVQKFLPQDTEETAAGHLHRRRQGIQSTKKHKNNSIKDLEPELEGTATIKPDRKERVGVHLVDIAELNGIIATDQTGRLPVTSQQGNQYIMVLYNYDSNVILAEAIKGRTDKKLIDGYEILYARIRKGGVEPVMQRLDNEASKALVHAIESKKLKYQLASPYSHRMNPAERAVQSFKNHFISNLHGTDTTFPANQWDRIIPQCEMTLNMLQRSRINPNISAYNQMFELYDYNSHPLAPLGTKAFVHERPEQRASFADHGKIGYVIRPAKDHYRHLQFYIPETRGIRVSDTYVFLPTKYEMPATAEADRLTLALEEVTEAISNRNEQLPFTDHSLNNAINALKSLLSPQQHSSLEDDATAARVNSNRSEQREPTVNNNNNSDRVLRPRVQPKKQNYSRGTRIFKLFGRKYYRGYIYDFDSKEGYYKV